MGVMLGVALAATVGVGLLALPASPPVFEVGVGSPEDFPALSPDPVLSPGAVRGPAWATRPEVPQVPSAATPTSASSNPATSSASKGAEGRKPPALALGLRRPPAGCVCRMNVNVLV